jgi:phenylalanyl-tRNA synthetase beta chain
MEAHGLQSVGCSPWALGAIMKVPLSWLRDYVDLPPSVSQLVERLTLAGLEVESVRVLGLPVPEGLQVKQEDPGPVWKRDKIIIGQVLGVEQHPNADRLTLATVDYGAGQPKTVVTGAPNLRVGDRGQKVIVALSGSLLFDGHASEKVLKELKPSKIRGVASDAMVCSAYELGISDEHEGIILLEQDAPVGRPLADFMGDIVLDIDVLPNMARCMSMIGAAREMAVLTGNQLRLPSTAVPSGGEAIEGKVQVTIADPKLSARYAAALIKSVKVGSAPAWMQRRLTYAGMRPISNIVDITNYVMLEWGQPLHAFDYDKLVQRAGGKSPTITVRPARFGEKIRTLDGQLRELTPDNLLIADEVGPITIAGVMGGADTEVSNSTTDILLESANFDFVSVRRTMKGFNLPSEASVRFSRGIHPEMVRPAAERAAGLMRDHAGGTACRGLVDCYPVPLPPQVVVLESREVSRVLGIELPLSEMTRVLQALEFKVEQSGPDRLRVTVPPHRLDIQAGSADLIEELTRIYGYDRLPATLLKDQLPEQEGNRSLMLEEQVRDLLVNEGLQEVISYSLTEPSREAPLLPAEGDYVRILNPISSERIVMRRTLLAGVLEVAAANLRQTEDVRLFEIGAIYLPRLDQKLPDEPRRLAVVMIGRRSPEFWQEQGRPGAPLDFYDLKGVIENLATDLHLPEVSYRPSATEHMYPGRAAELALAGQAVGSFGQLHPKKAEVYGLGDRAVFVGEFDVEAILAKVPERYPFAPVLRFPAALRDIAVVVEQKIPAEQVATEIHAAGGELLKRSCLFDVFQGESIPAGAKSLAYHLIYQAQDRTLTDKEVDKAHKKIEDRLKLVLKAQIRGKE